MRMRETLLQADLPPENALKILQEGFSTKLANSGLPRVFTLWRPGGRLPFQGKLRYSLSS